MFHQFFVKKFGTRCTLNRIGLLTQTRGSVNVLDHGTMVGNSLVLKFPNMFTMVGIGGGTRVILFYGRGHLRTHFTTKTFYGHHSTSGGYLNEYCVFLICVLKHRTRVHHVVTVRRGQ